LQTGRSSKIVIKITRIFSLKALLLDSPVTLHALGDKGEWRMICFSEKRGNDKRMSTILQLFYANTHNAKTSSSHMLGRVFSARLNKVRKHKKFVVDYFCIHSGNVHSGNCEFVACEYNTSGDILISLNVFLNRVAKA